MLTSYIMSEEVPRDLKAPPEAGKLTDISRNGNSSKKQVENIDENHKEKEREKPVLLVELIHNGDSKVNSAAEMGNSEVEYIESENLEDVEDVDMSLKENVIPLVVKSLKNPRSAVCKTAIMTSADIFKAYCDGVVDSMDPLVSLFNFC